MTNQPGVYIKTLGCKVNQYDTQALRSELITQQFRLCESPELADIAIINSCSVTNSAEKEARYLARHYKRQNPNIKNVITGCYAQTDGKSLDRLDSIDHVVPGVFKAELVPSIIRKFGLPSGVDDNLPKQPEKTEHEAEFDLVEDNRQSHFKSSHTLVNTFSREIEELPSADDSPDNSRVNVKVQDGCNGFCTYCLIPYARGSSVSVPLESIIQGVESLVKRGVLEIVLTGIHIGDYGKDWDSDSGNTKNLRFADLLQSVAPILEGKARLRISSLEPAEIDDNVLAALEQHSSIICPHFHLPLQSGSDRILKKMRRQYTLEEYSNSLQSLRRIFDSPCLGADVIPGFPDESEEDFAHTVQFIKDMELAYLHVFPYSKRKNTAALRMPGHLPAPLIKERAGILRDLSASLWHNYQSAQRGKPAEIVWQHKIQNGRRRGKSERYLDVCSLPLPERPSKQNTGGATFGLAAAESASNSFISDQQHLKQQQLEVLTVKGWMPGYKQLLCC